MGASICSRHSSPLFRCGLPWSSHLQQAASLLQPPAAGAASSMTVPLRVGALAAATFCLQTAHPDSFHSGMSLPPPLLPLLPYTICTFTWHEEWWDQQIRYATMPGLFRSRHLSLTRLHTSSPWALTATSPHYLLPLLTISQACEPESSAQYHWIALKC